MKTDDAKADVFLGAKVEAHLKSLGIETPMTRIPSNNAEVTKSVQLQAIAEHVAGILKVLGMDLTDDSLADTPKRVAKMYLNEIFWGLDYDNFPKATVVENKMQVDEMVLERNITVNSTCEHHILPIIGYAHVAYIAADKVLGLSKINRIVEFFCRRPQIQERLASQICETLKLVLGTDHVAVLIEAEHMCVRTRGVEDACSDTVTSKLSGVFKTNATAKAEFLSLVSMGKKR